MHKMLVEICSGSYEDVLAADRGGADRAELCSALELGGLTPSLGTLTLCKQHTRIKVCAMVRPRAGGFLYSPEELDVMRADAKLLLSHGADGLVFGFLHADGTVDEARTREFVALCDGKDAVFHRAFDCTPDPIAALDTLIACGVTRILTSGQQASSLDGAALLKRLVARAAGRVQIQPGGGINAGNVQDVIRQSGVDMVHFVAWESRVEPSLDHTSIRFNAPSVADESHVMVATEREVAKMVRLANEA